LDAFGEKRFGEEGSCHLKKMIPLNKFKNKINKKMIPF
jgi:hypothetical protein